MMFAVFIAFIMDLVSLSLCFGGLQQQLADDKLLFGGLMYPSTKPEGVDVRIFEISLTRRRSKTGVNVCSPGTIKQCLKSKQ